MVSLTQWTWIWASSRMDREAWHAAVHRVTKSWTRLSNWTEMNWNELNWTRVQYYTANCVSWVTRLTFLDLYKQFGLMNALSEWSLLVCRGLTVKQDITSPLLLTPKWTLRNTPKFEIKKPRYLNCWEFSPRVQEIVPNTARSWMGFMTHWKYDISQLLAYSQ